MDENSEFKYIEMRLVDIMGKIRGMVVPLSKPCTFDKIKDDPVLSKGVNVDGSSLPEFSDTENSDLHLHPDLFSITKIPFTKLPKAGVFCSLFSRSQENDVSSPFLGDARTLLQQKLNELFPGKTIRIKPEPEFYLYLQKGDELITADEGGYIDVAPADESSHILFEISEALKEAGMNVHYHHHEVGPGQYEIEIEFDEILSNCDNMALFKPIVKAIADKNGFKATFMPKPFPSIAGSGLHVHIQIWDGEKNLFGNEQSPGEITDYAKQFIAGILQHAEAITAIGNPSINSYKRLVPGYEAPVYITWGYRNRSTLVRVPLFRDAKKAAIEIRSADFTTNPYLLLVALLHAGFDGVKNHMVPPQPRKENVFDLTKEQLSKEGIGNLPSNLGESIKALEDDLIVYNSLGSHLGPRWLSLLNREFKDYMNLTVTDFERKHYLDC